ncbi:imm11 family protein [Carnobacterium gallinarum]|uniref:imm11 family protein n=1 Tax=Carnobacterium gallinarum TaxID=2749 RepID=UPI000552BCB7|nr:DUF1629 domain-containing protein [Carnobacterium gallinarum]
MKYYKLSTDMIRSEDIICHYENDFGIQQNDLVIGKKFDGWDGRFKFSFDQKEGHLATDYLANDKGWFVVSLKLKKLLESLNTDIQFLPVEIIEKDGKQKLPYYIGNIIRVVDALCLEESDYFSTEISTIGTIYTVSKFAVYEKKIQKSDVFKLANRQEVPVFVSENFKNLIEKNNITGITLTEIKVI